MKKMRTRHIVSFLLGMAVAGLLFGALACGGGGGGGSQQTATIQGNVTDQVAALKVEKPTIYAKIIESLSLVSTAHAAVEGVQVSIVEFPELATVTDDTGFFLIRNVPGGAPLTLAFTVPGATLTLQVNAPAGSTVTVQDISLNTSAGTASAAAVNVDDSSSSNDNSSDNGDTNANGNTNDGGSNSNDGNANSNDSNSNDDDSNSNGDDDSNSNGDDSNSNGDDDDSNDSNSGSGNGNDDDDDSDDDDSDDD